MSSRSRDIAMILTKAVFAQRLVPGAKLGERELSEIMNVSRTVVRQALIRLAEDGLVTLERNRGAFVAKPSLQEALEIYDTLTLLEQGVATQQNHRLGKAAFAELRQQIARQRQAHDDNNSDLGDELAQDFHSLLVRLGGNRVVIEIHAQLIRRTRLLKSLFDNRFDYCNLIEDHERIVDLLEAGRSGQASKLMDAHHHRVARGYIMEEISGSTLTLREALAPFVGTDATGMYRDDVDLGDDLPFHETLSQGETELKH
jgi:DNA-binding GntR family transcriptional regulator